jgi:hypothetical protein
MKKLVLSLVVAAFAVAVQAGESCSEKASSCCAAKNASKQVKAECPMAKQAKATSTKADKVGAKQASVKQPLKSPKANS